MISSPPSHGQNAVPVELTPDPGFCVKTRVQPDGHKLFVNICHHPAIPSAEGHLPLVLSERRDGSDKGEPGQPCIIFDAIFNPTVCSKAAKDTKLRGTLIVDVRTTNTFDPAPSLVITPHVHPAIATPNIKSKGAIPPRTARIPAFWASSENISTARIQELGAPAVPSWNWSPTREGCRIVIHVPELVSSSITLPLGRSPRRGLLIIPLTTGNYRLDWLGLGPWPVIAQLVLPIRPWTNRRAFYRWLYNQARRLIFTAGPRYHLDTPLLPPKQGTGAPVGGTKFLPTTVDPDSAVAEWNVKKNELVVQIKWASVVAREKEKEKE
ncbi:PIH1 domain-containing protein [Rhizoctonia solani AG-1 IA]|uniref:PIH1 domain-containing protein n=1 Tax=Thanatephorus cucumeris (strain AG1-IA) TaxID=983506 RepID=L8WL94_THACA|nr:PIH1 domain-containing protein [Rhizoctonia solani AG-1 IA]